MSSKQAYKAVLILGNDEKSGFNDEYFNGFLELYDKNRYKIIGNYKEGVNLDTVTDLKGRIDSSTRIDFLGHGLAYDDGSYYIQTDTRQIHAGEFFTWLRKQTTDKNEPLHVHLWSCHSQGAIPFAQHLGHGSVLFAHVAKTSTALKDLNLFSLKAAIANLESSSSNPFQQFMDQFSTNSLQSAHIAIPFKDKKFEYISIAPSIGDVLKRSQKTLNAETKKFDSYYSSQRGKFNAEQIKNDKSLKQLRLEKLKIKKIDKQKSEEFEVGYLIHSCQSDNITELQKIARDKEGQLKLKSLVNKNIDGISTTMLIGPAAGGYNKMAKFLLKLGANPDTQDNVGDTALHHAARENKAEIVSLLLQHNANPQPLNIDKISPLHSAAEECYIEIGKRLIDRLVEVKADLNTQNKEGDTVLSAAAAHGCNQIVEYLFLKGEINSDIQDKNGITALFYAAQNNHFVVVDTLLDNNASVDIPRNVDRATPLLIATGLQNVKAVRSLAEHNANTNLPDKNGDTPLCKASSIGNKEIVEILIEALHNKNDVNQKCEYGLTAIYRASQYNHYEIAELLLKNGANPNIQSDNGATSLHVAVGNGHIGVVKLLYSYGADCSIKAKNGYNCLVGSRPDVRKELDEMFKSPPSHIYVANGPELIPAMHNNKLQEHFDEL